MAAPAANLYDHVRIGAHVFPFTGLAEVSAAYRATIDRLGCGVSHTPQCKIFDATGRQTAHVSYNGRVWAYDPNAAVERILYDPTPAMGFVGGPRLVGARAEVSA